MGRTADHSGALWALLGLWISLELLFSSRWWPPQGQPLFHPSPVPTSPQILRTVLAQQSGSRVWFAPYTTFPETGFLESKARRGVYDTFLAVPIRAGLSINYGANKLSPADTLFSRASVQGLATELRLARQLGYGFFALDLGAVTDPAVAARVCRHTPGCRLSGDGYALFPIGVAPQLDQQLTRIQRRMPLLPYQSSGPSWGPLVFNPQQWGPVELRPADRLGAVPALVVQASAPDGILQIYRYPSTRYPLMVRSELRLANNDVRLVLASDVHMMQICIGLARGSCRLLKLTRGRRSIAIGALLPEGQLTQFQVQAIQRDTPWKPPFDLELRRD